MPIKDLEIFLLEDFNMRTNYEIIKSSEFKKLAAVPKHYTSNVREHSLRVAYVMWKLSSFFRTDRYSAVRVGLLHDMCYTMPEERSSRKGYYVFYHPLDAVTNAQKYYGISKREENAIRFHMFPVCPGIPTNAIGWNLFIADKIATAWDYYAGFKKTGKRQEISVMKD